MTSPKKILDAEKDSTFFGELEKVEVLRPTHSIALKN